MKKFFSICYLAFVFSISLKAQQPTGGEVKIPQNTETCLSALQRQETINTLEETILQLKRKGMLQPINTRGSHPLFNWPVSQANGFNYNQVWSVSNYIDHNPAFPNQISDYECGTRSYDTSAGYNHQGFDIITWPFWWKQMDLDQGIIVAAADGQIIGKDDGSFDRNCSFNTNPWNAVYLQHSDGSKSWYLHMKNGSLTSKNVGDTVVAGEFLGVIGSSGSSTVPHLHFEVYDSTNQLIDPSIGPCNNFNSDTWWVNQKPYYTPAINAALTHTGTPIFPTCPLTETTFESNQFSLGEMVYYGVYLKDQQPGTSLELKITRPDNSIFQQWNYGLTDYYQISYWMWNYPNDMEGSWKFEVTYQGETVIHSFTVGELSLSENKLNNTKVYPNPIKNSFFINSEETITKVIIRDILGKTVMAENHLSGIKEVKVPYLSRGMYFITLYTEEDLQKTIKVIKN
ncbi:MAG: peptidoglycan DD-metalloendopeptidase family protein [Flavobacteriaceae bacterium]